MKPWPKEPLIKKYNRIKGLQASSTGNSVQQSLPPYPSDEHFVGIWRLVSSPGDSNYANPDALPAFDSSFSDNIILRVDGTVAGGPILDSTTNQKAAGGTWKMFHAEYVGTDTDQIGFQDKLKTRMRIRLLIPPKKEEELVLEGEVVRIMMPRPSSVISTIGLTDTMHERNGDISDGEGVEAGLLQCGGEAWIQNIATGKRKKLGLFSVMKLRTPEQGELHFSVPPPRR